MNNNADQIRFLAFFRRNEQTVYKVASHFYICNSYYFHDMVSRLVEHLWMVYSSHSADTDTLHEEQWVGMLLFRKALNIYRNNLRHENRFPVDSSVSVDCLPSPHDDEKPNIRQLYRLIARLDKEDRDLLYLYLDEVPIKEIAQIKGRSYLFVNRWLHRIEKKLIILNETEGDGDDNDNN